MSIGNPPYDEAISLSLNDWLIQVQEGINQERRPIFIEASQFTGYSSTAGGSIQSDGAGAPILEEISSFGVVGVRIEAISDAVHHLFYVPPDFQVDSNIIFNVVWLTNSSDTSETATWRIRYETTAPGETMSAPSTALDEAISADTVLGSNIIAESPDGVLNAQSWQHGDYVNIEVSLTATLGLDPSSDTVYLLGLLIRD